MLVVRLEVWPFGDESLKHELGRGTITNDQSGDLEIASYDVSLDWLSPQSRQMRKRRGAWRRGRVEHFPRHRLGPWDLLYRALKDTVGKRF
jgi:hypothetical protein